MMVNDVLRNFQTSQTNPNECKGLQTDANSAKGQRFGGTPISLPFLGTLIIN